jgi:hypothetical protein
MKIDCFTQIPMKEHAVGPGHGPVPFLSLCGSLFPGHFAIRHRHCNTHSNKL